MIKKSGSRVSFSARSRKDVQGEGSHSLSKEQSNHSSSKSSSNFQNNYRMQSAKLPSSIIGTQSQQQFATLSSNNGENININIQQQSKRSKIPQYLKEMNILEKKQNEKIIKNMNKRINFMRNPRYEIIRPPIQFTDIQSKPDLFIDVDSSASLFRAIPSYLLFQNYLINEVYEINLKIVNVSKISRRIKFLPPQSDQFAISRVAYPGEIASKYETMRSQVSNQDVYREKGMIAPGMSLNLNIKFFATSFSEFRDEITFISEENIFKIPIVAQKEAPSISLPEVLDCQSCWLGDRADMVFRIQNKGGEAGFKFFCEDQKDDSKQNGETLQTDSFTLYPSEFYIQKGEVVEIFVTFTPKNEGITQERIILACDNLTSATYTLQGTGNMAELGIHGIDHVILSEIPELKQMDPQQVLKKIFFNDASPGTIVSRYVTIQNKAQVRVKYHWALSKNDKRTSAFEIGKPEDDYFSIDPPLGYFEKGEIKKFKVSFSSRDPIPVYEYANLIIDDISIESIRNPPDSIRRIKDIPQVLTYEDNHIGNSAEGNFSEEIQEFNSKGSQHHHGQIVKPGFIGSNTDRPSLTYFEFELIGLSTYSKVVIDPPFQVFPGQLFINKIYYKDFQIMNLSESELSFNISVCEQYACIPTLIADIKHKSGTIAPRQRTTVTVGFSSKEIGENKTITFRVDFDKAHSIVVELVGEFIGPKINFSIPMVDFGLIKAGDVGKYKFELKNDSDVEAEFLFKESENEGTFDDHKNVILKRLANERISNQGKSFIHFRDENEKFYKKAQERICFEPSYATIPPKGKIQIEVKCGCEDACSISKIFECMVKNGDSIILNLFAEIQKIHVSLNRFMMKTDTLYACNEYTFLKGKTPLYIELQNLGNLPCAFEWETEADEKVEKRELIKYNFIPTKGIIPPKSKLPIKFQFQPIEGGIFNELFVLNCEGVELPLGFELKAEVLGLSVEYDLIQSTSENVNPNLSSLEATSRALAVKHKLKSMGSGIDHKQQTQAKQHKLEDIEFYDCKINKPKSVKICIRNTSGVNTTFEIFTQKYQPYLNDEVKSPASMVLPNSMLDDISMISGAQSTSNNGKMTPINKGNMGAIQDSDQQLKGIRFSQSINSVQSQVVKRESKIGLNRKSLKPLPQRHVVLLNDDIEKKNNFTSTSGQALNQTKRQDKDQRIYLANNKGIAILCEPSRGKLKAHSEVIVKITCFNDICGSFKDECIVDIKGLPLEKFPLVAEVKGSPVIVLPNQLGISYKGDWPCFNIGTYMRNINPVKREFKLSNTGPKAITLDWKIFNLDQQKEVSQFFQIKIDDPHLGSGDTCQLKFLPVEPQEAQNSPFTILEKDIKVEGRSEKVIKIEYNSQIDTNYSYVMVGKPRLLHLRDSYSVISQAEGDNHEDHPSLNMGTVAVYLKATSIYPQLHLDKLKNVEGCHKLKFEKWALTENKKQSKSVCLVNLLQSNLLFNVQIVGPFKIMQSGTNSQAKFDSTKVVQLLNKDKLEIETKFNLVQNSNLKLNIDFQGPKVNDQEEWPLTYKVYKYGVLHINYINGDSQVIELEGQLLRPYIQINTSGTEDVKGVDVQDFGTVHINNFKTMVIYLSNLSKVPANWKLNHLKTAQRRGNSAIPQNTMTKLQIEDSLRNDDPSVFEFQISEGTLIGPSISVKSFPDTLALPCKKTSALLQQQQLYPQKIYINFRPKTNVMYKSKFRITVQEGPYIDFTVKGYGSYEENKFK